MFDTKVPVYGIFIIISIIFGLVIVYKNVKSLNYKKEEIIGLLIYIFLGAIFGGKYFTFITNYQKLNGVFEFSKVGLSSYGGIIGVLILVFIFSKQYKKKFNDLLYILMPSIPLIYSVGKIGCFLVGCCYGIEYNGPFNIVYNYSYDAPKGVSLFPIQLLESIVFMVIFLYFYYKVRKQKFNYKIIGQLFFIMGITKFMLDYLRMSHVGQVISINQIVSLLFIFIGIFLIFSNKDKNKI